MTTYKTYNVLPGTFVSDSFPPIPPFYVQGANPDPPAWFEWLEGGFGTFSGYTFTAPATPGEYIIGFAEFGNFSPYQIIINVIAAELTEYANCCDNQRNIAWYNIQGGWQNYIFTGVKTFEIKIGDSKQFKTSELVQKHSQINGVYSGEIVSTGDIPKSHVDLLDSLQHSIQAFLYNDESENWDIPILIDVDSFVKYKSTDKLFEVKIRFIYAEEIVVQTQ